MFGVVAFIIQYDKGIMQEDMGMYSMENQLDFGDHPEKEN